MTDEPEPRTVWRAALEQLPPDARGFRRTLRLHAVAFQASRPAPRAVCGYEHREGELRPDRTWETVTSSGRCTLCDLQLRRASDTGVGIVDAVDLVESDDRGRDPGASATRPRLSVVSDEPDPPERRSPQRPGAS